MVTMNEMTERTQVPLAPRDDEEGSFFKVYVADTGIMFYKFPVDPRLWLEAQSGSAFVTSSDFRGALAENVVMQALSSNDLQTYYWVPPSAWHTTGELDFLLQTRHAEVVPIEVKSARNVRAKTLATFMSRAHSPCAYVLSENDFSVTGDETAQIRHLPLYAAHCIGTDCMKAS